MSQLENFLSNQTQSTSLTSPFYETTLNFTLKLPFKGSKPLSKKGKRNIRSLQKLSMSARGFHTNSSLPNLTQFSARSYKPSVTKNKSAKLNLDPLIIAQVVENYILPIFKQKGTKQSSPAIKQLFALQGTVLNELEKSVKLSREIKNVKQTKSNYERKLKDSVQALQTIQQRKRTLQGRLAKSQYKVKCINDRYQCSQRQSQLSNQQIDFLNMHLTQYKQLKLKAEQELKWMKSEIQEESAFNDKVENHAIQYQEAGKLMSAENVIINRSLSKLNNTIEKVDRRIIFEQSISTDLFIIAKGLLQDAMVNQQVYINSISNNAIKEQINVHKRGITENYSKIKADRDIIKLYFRKTYDRLKSQFQMLLENITSYQEKIKEIEKMYKSMLKEHNSNRQKLKQFTKISNKYGVYEENTCKYCNKLYNEFQNFNWSCKTHQGNYSLAQNVWWCCGKVGKDAQGCQLRKHTIKEEDEELILMQNEEEDRIIQKKSLCSSCKQHGHKRQMCPNDPNIRSVFEVEDDKKRVFNLKKKHLVMMHEELIEQVLALIEQNKGQDVLMADMSSSFEQESPLLEHKLRSAFQEIYQLRQDIDFSDFKNLVKIVQYELTDDSRVQKIIRQSIKKLSEPEFLRVFSNRLQKSEYTIKISQPDSNVNVSELVSFEDSQIS